MVTPKLSAKNGAAYVKIKDRPDPATLQPLFELEPLPPVEHETIKMDLMDGTTKDVIIPTPTPLNLLIFEIDQIGLSLKKMSEVNSGRFSPANFTKVVKQYVALFNRYCELQGRPAPEIEVAEIDGPGHSDDAGAIPGNVPGREPAAGNGQNPRPAVDTRIPAENPFARQRANNLGTMAVSD